MNLPLRPSRLPLSLRITLTFAIGALVLSEVVAVGSYLFTARFLINEQKRTSLHQS